MKFRCLVCVYIKHPLSHPSIDFDFMNSIQIDLQAESIRSIHYPHMPSRFKCIFGLNKLSDLLLWKQYFKITKSTCIYEIEIPSNNCVLLDASFLKGHNFRSRFDMCVTYEILERHDFK